MADIQSAAQWLGRLLIVEGKYLYEVKKKVLDLRDELYWMQCFLGDADASYYDNVVARRWVSQFREFNYEAEDIIEEYFIKVVRNTRDRKIFPKNPFLVHMIGSKIDALKNKISLLTSKLQTFRSFDINLRLKRNSSSWLGREKYVFTSLHEKIMISRGGDFEKLVGILSNGGTEGRSIVSICGVGGVGKTFLARKIYNSPSIRKHFDAFAWAYVSEPFRKSAVQQDLLSCLTSISLEDICQMADYELQDELCKFQCKYKCFIVLDGLYGKEVWDDMKDSFPITNRKFGSKLLITNRPAVAEYVGQYAFIHKLKVLDEKDSKIMLLEEMVKTPDDVLHDFDSFIHELKALDEKDSKIMPLKEMVKNPVDVLHDFVAFIHKLKGMDEKDSKMLLEEMVKNSFDVLRDFDASIHELKALDEKDRDLMLLEAMVKSSVNVLHAFDAFIHKQMALDEKDSKIMFLEEMVKNSFDVLRDFDAFIHKLKGLDEKDSKKMFLEEMVKKSFDVRDFVHQGAFIHKLKGMDEKDSKKMLLEEMVKNSFDVLRDSGIDLFQFPCTKMVIFLKTI